MNTSLIVLGGVFMGIGFIFPHLWPLSLIGFIPLILFLRSASVRETFLLGGLFGFIFYGLAFWSVFWHTIPLDWVGTELPYGAQLFFVGAAWLFATLTCTISFLAFAFLVRALASGTWNDLVVIPAAWVVTEYTGLWLLSLSLLGPSSLVGPHIAFAALGQLIADDTFLIQFAALGGMSALSFLVVGINTLVYLGISTKPPVRRYVVLLSVCLLSVWGVFHLVEPREATGSETLKIALVSTRGSAYPRNPDEEPAYAETIRSLLSEARDSDVIVLPEASAFLGERWSPTPDELQKLVSPFTPVILDSRALNVNGTWRRVIEYHQSAHARSEYAFKYFLAPYGEYLPYAFRALAWVTRYEKEVAAIDEKRRYVRGNEAYPHVINAIRIGTILCQEIVSPSIAREQVRRGAEILLNPNSLVWYHGSESMFARMLRHTKVRAVENRRPVLQVGDTSPSFVIDRFGREIARASSDENILRISVAPSRKVTPYTAISDWWLLLPLILILWTLGRKRLEKRLDIF